jgi:hypothetical protein
MIIITDDANAYEHCSEQNEDTKEVFKRNTHYHSSNPKPSKRKVPR